MDTISLAFTPRYVVFTLSVLVAIACLLLSFVYAGFLIPFLIAAALAGLGVHDVLQKKHSILRNYPIAAHIRFLLEEIRPEIRQYFLESDTDGAPFSRDKRSIVYQRAKGQLDKKPFGTQLDVYGTPFEWLNHSIAARSPSKDPFRVMIGGPDCKQPYSASVFNISAMSFGALSPNAVRALNKGAKKGGFAHDTGEGGFSPYHREYGGDIIWEIGSGYFGCRNPDGTFSAERFAETVASPQIKMVEIKLSQGAKPGHGGVLPGAKVSAEIAATRGVVQGVDCISPPSHSAFSTPMELMQFIARLRDLSGGRPVGFKLCVGHPWEFLGICKAMLESNIYPDFIVVDGTEGGTGAAPLEFIDHIGMPLRDGLMFVHNALVGLNIRDRIRIGASGKITSAFDIARVLALGADWGNAARGFMFALGCIQSTSCHTDRCPVGVATQDPLRMRALVVPDKAERVYRFHRSTLKALAEVVAAAGLEHPQDLQPRHFSQRVAPNLVQRFDQIYRFLKPGELLAGTDDPRFADAWRAARADSFAAG
ncbi:FMN-binding glutamate synthase family protein [Reyranella sp. CPCC 100927]|uniref:FMN-binding glutamate synthase family protein n=1 Tax=Reyranella sp. CPCC 100927 TaxID=2599616 RepID=UPI0011B6BB05|nr:FMN-binding glutamate synthase family protein [Reyranella sp. CPCC 100927]TWT06107.1 FMN-binding glutamate synthase family protein [Reyranella sp. CPCC 100927]